MTSFRVLDLFSCAGGAGMGYARAGADVVSVDTDARALAENPHKKHQADALDFLRHNVDRFDLVHASPPCQRFTRGNVSTARADKWPDLIGPTRDILRAWGGPYVIENVAGARTQLINPVTLCGTMFGLTAIDDDGTLLYLQRHRLFEVNWEGGPIDVPPHPHTRGVQWAGVYGGARRDKWEARHVRKGGYVPPNLDVLRALLRTPWIRTERYLFEAIPPAYTEFIGHQFLRR